MNDSIILFAIYIIFFLISIFLYRKAVLVKGRILYIFIVLYFLFIYIYFELINYIHILLRDKGVYFEFGHASISLVVIWFLAVLTAMALVTVLLIKRKK